MPVVMSVALSQRLPLPSQLGLLAALGSGALLGGAYYFQYVVGLPPCDLCYLQRWPHMVAIAVVLLQQVAGYFRIDIRVYESLSRADPIRVGCYVLLDDIGYRDFGDRRRGGLRRFLAARRSNS